jgi:hypothetical protein
MIDIDKLTTSDVGRWVEYTAFNQRETGRIKDWTHDTIFVVYHCDNQWDRFQDFTGEGTEPDSLNFIKSPTENK